jgi:hypothetical protein
MFYLLHHKINMFRNKKGHEVCFVNVRYSFVILQAILSTLYMSKIAAGLGTKDLHSAANSVSGTVTNYGTTMSNVRCSPHAQHIVIKRAVYGDFNQKGVSAGTARIDPKCNILTNCQVKSRCGGKKSCKLVINQNVLPSQYCSGTRKKIYTEYACVDTYHSTTITGKLDILKCTNSI